jgi:tetratricopeptide (TPR) repeat protein
MAFFNKIKTNKYTIMKINPILIAGTLLISVASFAQKDELKALKKIYGKEEIKGADLSEYKALVVKVEPLASLEADKVYANFYKSMIPVLEYMALDKSMTPLQIQLSMAKFVNPVSISELAIGLNATLDYEKKVEKKIQTDDIIETISFIKPTLLNYAIALEKDKKVKESADVLYSIYQLDRKDQENLYYAASYATKALNYEKALQYYNELKALNYTGEGTLYIAKNKATDKEESYQTKEDRDNLIKLGTHSSPREEKSPSVKSEITRNIALILLELGRTDEAKTAFTDARKENPNDIGLITSEADIYLKLKDYTNYEKLINEALLKNPNDEILLFNLGVTNANANKLEEAEKYYKRVIELKPDYIDAYLNLADLYLKPDTKYVEEMLKIKGTSESEMKKYNAIKADREKIFNKAMPILEKAHQLDPKNDIVKSNLKSIYNYLELMDKVKALKEEN